MPRSKVQKLGLVAIAAFGVALAQCDGPLVDLRARKPAPTATGQGGGITFTVPTPSPVLCTPAPVLVAVGQPVTIDCTAQGYSGMFTWTVADPSIASVQQFNNETFTFFKVTGLKVGTTTLSLQSQPGGTGTDTIVVSP